MSAPENYNPLEQKNLAESVARALLSQPVLPLGTIDAFTGVGIYAIYYTGPFPAYKEVSKANSGGNFTHPIYVGKAVPPGARKGLETQSGGRELYKRLKEHADSIESVANLDIKDFSCRYLIVDPTWIPLGESALISKTRPVWNALIDGFGNHDPGSGRYAGMQTKWDTLHTGRSWASKCKPRPESAEKITEQVEKYLSE